MSQATLNSNQAALNCTLQQLANQASRIDWTSKASIRNTVKGITANLDEVF